jgi:uncharacterized 2Fe-2S/4Fe-4S cluster protein (DUF4445 family)
LTDKSKQQYDIRFLPDDVTVKGSVGEAILKLALKAGVYVNTTCGGAGTCGSCRIIIKKGQVESTHSSALSSQEIEQGVQLACQSRVISDVTIEVMQDIYPSKETATRPDYKSAQPLDEIAPLVKKIALKLPVPTLADNRPDLKRLEHGLKSHGYEKMFLDYDVLKSLPEVSRNKNWEVTATLAMTSPIPTLSRLESGNTAVKNYGCVFDIGTTAVRGRLVDLNDGNILASEMTYNKQRSFGDDVITRITRCRKTGGIEAIQQATVNTLNELIKNMQLSSNTKPEDINGIVIAANTVMVQFLLGINPDPLRMSPYVPAIDSVSPVKAEKLGIKVGKHCRIHIIPVVASYVGGDIVAGVVASEMHKNEQTSLYIDIGTNGEVVLGKQDWMVTAACSAGPTFEGGGIKHGMLAVDGAIDDFNLINPCEAPVIRVIGDKNPAGICGSGLINTVSALYTEGILAQNGKFNLEGSCPRIRPGDDGFEYVIVERESTLDGKDIVLTEIDVDNFIRSKAAIYAGCQTLAESVGVNMQEIDSIIIAGTFGNHINIENAIKVGLLPDLGRERFHFIGNGSLAGAYKAILSVKTNKKMLEIADAITSIELSENQLFMDNYVASLFLPHTDLSKFPTVTMHTKK